MREWKRISHSCIQSFDSCARYFHSSCKQRVCCQYRIHLGDDRTTNRRKHSLQQCNQCCFDPVHLLRKHNRRQFFISGLQSISCTHCLVHCDCSSIRICTVDCNCRVNSEQSSNCSPEWRLCWNVSDIHQCAPLGSV